MFSASFNSGQDSFTYLDDVFKGTQQPSYASGSRVSSGGFSGGALRVLLGGVNGNRITNMSGGWRRTFTLSAASTVTLTLRYNLNQGSNYETDEISQVLATMDGTLVPVSPGYVAQVAGNGEGGAATTTGWQQITMTLGPLSSGSHTLTVGGFNNKKTDVNEQTAILIDDVVITRP